MDNLETKLLTILPNKLGTNLTHVTLTTFPTPTLYTLHSGAEIQFTSHPLDLSEAPKSQHITTNSKPVALTLHNELPLLACRDGALISLRDAEHLGDFTDDNPEKSGILAATSSPDGCLLLVVSPVSVSVLDADFEITAELPCEGIASDARVSWRSDGDFFVVLRQVGKNTVGFAADRACKLMKPLELDDIQTECCIDWEPRPGGMVTLSSGNIVLFFERNGLRHRRSDLDVGRNVSLLRWSVDARALLIFGEGVLDIWMKRNYVWYCKKRMVLHDFVDALWDEDDPKQLRIFTSTGQVIVLRFDVVPSTCLSLERDSLLAVTQGHSVIFTSLAAGLVPPPMSHGHLAFHAGVETISCLASSDMLGFLLADGSIETAVLNEPFGKPLLSSDLLRETSLPAIRNKWRLPVSNEGTTRSWLPYRAHQFVAEDIIAVVKQQKQWVDRDAPNDVVQIYKITPGEAIGVLLGKYVADGHITSMCTPTYIPESITITISSGNFAHLSVDPDSGEYVEVSRIACKAAQTACSVLSTRVKGNLLLGIVQSEEGLLELLDTDAESSTVVCDQCTSFTLLGDFLVYTTRSNLLHCLPLRKEGALPHGITDTYSVPIAPSNGANGFATAITFSAKGAIRPIDRGSVIVGSLEDGISVVLQAPRGNLETIVPRPAVHNRIKKLVECENFGDAFALCRRQRIDMNYIVDTNFPLFLKNVDKFVSQIGNPEHLSVFMTLLSGNDSKVNAVCEAVVETLQQSVNESQFTSALLTGMMKQGPQNFEGALSVIKRAYMSSKEKGRAAVDFLFVLVKNQEVVYGHALGTYDLELARFVAESSQMDPAAYHPELTSLRKMGDRDRKTAIDLRLERYGKALVHLHDAGRNRFQECVSLCLQHCLYDTALPLFRDEKDIMKVLLDGYGKYLKTKAQFDEAAAVFRQIGNSRNACECYSLAGRWQLASYCLSSSALPEDEKVVLWNSIATDLEENGRVVESAQVRVNFLGETATALTSLMEAEEWEAAFEIATRGNVSPLEDDEQPRSYTGLSRDLVQSATCFKGDLDENRKKVRDRRQRLTTLRSTKQFMREHLARKQSEQEADSDVFSESTASSLSNLSDITFYSKTSATSLYSTATQTGPLSDMKLEKKALKRKQRESKKRIREGHPREEEAIVAYVRKLLPTDFTLRRTEKFIRALLFVQKANLAGTLTGAFREYISEALTLPNDVLGDEKLRLETVLKDWMGHLPRAMAHVYMKAENVQEDV